MKRYHFSCLILLTCLLTLAACGQTSKEKESSDDQETVSTEENTQQALSKEEKVYREFILQSAGNMGKSLDGITKISEKLIANPKDNSEDLINIKQDTAIRIFAIIQTSENVSCPSDRFTEVCNNYDSLVSNFQDIYDNLSEAYDDLNENAINDNNKSAVSITNTTLKLSEELEKLPSE